MTDREIIKYQLAAAILAIGLGYAAARYGGHFLHDRQAETIAHGEGASTDQGRHEIAKELSHGYKDTKAFAQLKDYLEGDELAKATTDVHPAELYCVYVAIACGVFGFFASTGAARLRVRKLAAQAQLQRTTQRFGPPGR